MVLYQRESGDNRYGWLPTYIDTIVILDIIFNRKGCEAAINLFKRAEQDRSSIYITASVVTDLFYIIRKETHNTEKTYEILKNVFKLTKIISVTEQDIMEAFEKGWKDFEDCVQVTIAQNNKMDYIITNNKKDYVNSSLPVLSPQEYLMKK